MVSYDATGPQKRAIAQLASALGMGEPIEEKPMTSGEAGRLIRELSSRLKIRRQELDDVKLKRRRCRWCGETARRTRFGLCIMCGRFQ